MRVTSIRENNSIIMKLYACGILTSTLEYKFIKNYDPDEISIGYLGNILYAQSKNEPVIPHLVDYASLWGPQHKKADRLQCDALEIEKFFPEINYTKKYLNCLIRSLKQE